MRGFFVLLKIRSSNPRAEQNRRAQNIETSVEFLPRPYRWGQRLAPWLRPKPIVLAPFLAGTNTATAMAGLTVDRGLTSAGKPNGLAISCAVHLGSAILLFAVLRLFLPTEPTVQANFQTFPVPAAYLKSILYFLFLAVVFWLPAFHFVVAMQREVAEGRSRDVWMLLMNDAGSVGPQGIIYPRFSVLLRLWVIVCVIGLYMTFHLFDNLKPSPNLNLFMSLVQVRFSLFLLLGTS